MSGTYVNKNFESDYPEYSKLYTAIKSDSGSVSNYTSYTASGSIGEDVQGALEDGINRFKELENECNSLYSVISVIVTKYGVCHGILINELSQLKKAIDNYNIAISNYNVALNNYNTAKNKKGD